MQSFLVGLVGSGIDASLSPALHEGEAAAQGLEYSYRLLDIDRLDAGVGELLARARARNGFAGLNVTHPCKQLVDGARRRALAAGRGARAR